MSPANWKAAAAMAVAIVAFAPSPGARPVAADPTPLPFVPVVTPDGATLPWKLVDGVKDGAVEGIQTRPLTGSRVARNNVAKM